LMRALIVNISPIDKTYRLYQKAEKLDLSPKRFL
jgi:hypothetical protein